MTEHPSRRAYAAGKGTESSARNGTGAVLPGTHHLAEHLPARSKKMFFPLTESGTA